MCLGQRGYIPVPLRTPSGWPYVSALCMASPLLLNHGPPLLPVICLTHSSCLCIPLLSLFRCSPFPKPPEATMLARAFDLIDLDPRKVQAKVLRSFISVLYFLIPSFIINIYRHFSTNASARSAPKQLGPTAYLDGLRGVAAFVVYIVRHFAFSTSKCHNKAITDSKTHWPVPLGLSLVSLAWVSTLEFNVSLLRHLTLDTLPSQASSWSSIPSHPRLQPKMGNC